MTALVPIKTWLKGSTYLAWEARARKEGTTVAVLLAAAADRAVKSAAPTPRRTYVRVTDEMRAEIATMRAEGYSLRAIALRVGISVESARVNSPKEQQG